MRAGVRGGGGGAGEAKHLYCTSPGLSPGRPRDTCGGGLWGQNYFNSNTKILFPFFTHSSMSVEWSFPIYMMGDTTAECRNRSEDLASFCEATH